MLVQNQNSKFAKRKKTKINISLKKKQKNNKQKKSSKKKKLKRTSKKYLKTGGMFDSMGNVVSRVRNLLTGVPSIFYIGESILSTVVGKTLRYNLRSSFSPLVIPGLPDDDKIIKKIAFRYHDSYGRYSVMVITNNNNIFSYGHNNHGQLGLSDYKSNIEYSPSFILSNNWGRVKEDRVRVSRTVFTPKDVVMGNKITLILTENGSVVGCGNSWMIGERLGLDHLGQNFQRNSQTRDWIEIWSPGNNENKKAIQIVSGENHFMILLNDGSVHICGDGRKGQLGIGSRDVWTVFPLNNLLERKIKVKQIAAAGNASFILDENGKVYSCGSNEYFQTGLRNNDYGLLDFDVTEFTEVPIDPEEEPPVKVTQIAMGNTHTVLLTSKGQVYTCGIGRNGQLGLGEFIYQRREFTKVNLIQGMKCKKVFASNEGTIILTTDNTMFACGTNKHGNLGLPDKNNYYNLTEVTSFNDIVNDDFFKIINMDTIKQNILSITTSLNPLLDYWFPKIGQMTLPEFNPNTFLEDFLSGGKYEDAYSLIIESPLKEHAGKGVYMGDKNTLILLGDHIVDIKKKIEKEIKCHIMSEPRVVAIMKFLKGDEEEDSNYNKYLNRLEDSQKRILETKRDEFISLFSDCDDFKQVFGITP